MRKNKSAQKGYGLDGYGMETIEKIKAEYHGLLKRVNELERKEKELAKKLRISESMKLNILNSLPLNIFLEDREGRTLFANAEVLRVHNMQPEELNGKTVFDFFPKHIAEINRKDDLEVWRQRKLISKEVPVGFQGEERVMYTGKTIIQTENEDFLLGFGLDITDRVNAEQKLRESEEKFRNVVDQAADSFFLIGLSGQFININAAAIELLGYGMDKMLAMNVRHIFGILPEKMEELLDKAGSHFSCHFEDRMAASDGREIPVDINFRLIRIGEEQNFLALCRDIRDLKKSQEAIQHMAYHDALTGLPNRWYIQSFLKEYFRGLKQKKLGLLLLDLDHFKVINDSMGHHAGDKLLQEVAGRLHSVCCQGNIVARFGGDEFVVLMPELNSNEETIVASEKINQIMAQPFSINGRKILITTSIGISISPRDGSEINMLLRNADLAMYESKENGRNCYRLYDKSMDTRAMERMEKEIRLRQALETSSFLLHYQPKHNLKTNEMDGFEALVRWNREGKILYPGEFIDVAEETGLIVPLGEWVLREACRQCKEWHDLGYGHLSISVNLSPLQFRKQNLEKLIAGILEETGLPAHALELELTEGTVMHEPEKAAKVLCNLKALGVTIAIDDFGTGFSSLSYLKYFPIDVLKIDRSFIMDLTCHNTDESIALAVINLANSLKLKVVAEGVETFEQLAFLEGSTCNYAQGYYISRPLEAETALSFIKKSQLLV
ncbi:EAL domain-containing protein [Bacillus sp. FJAT-27445]|uniref:sensor domain-containing protein n=1 Tax=Bacillus sp. FJAT-27445 TaxID=1679166 RepID=UPI000A5E7363|nr:EAL domain-containing protein [Bacillus sp. FJAT-27445]